jgi:starch phosphorylase
MEIALEPEMPTYSGGLGILAGDTLRAAADAGLSMVGVSLVHRHGYFRQHLDASGGQSEEPQPWTPEQVLEALPQRASLILDGRQLMLRAWRYRIRGVYGHVVPVYLLDTALPENSAWGRALSDQLYGGDDHYRLAQELVLGLGGVAMLRALGEGPFTAYHMNEGHSALLTLALLEEQARDHDLSSVTAGDVGEVRKQCVFTTHTPIPAGHDSFELDLVRSVLGDRRSDALARANCCLDGRLNMTYLGLFFSHYINGVSMRHEDVSRDMFPGYPINAITNGVHSVTWASSAFQGLFDRHVPEWRQDNLYLRYAVGIPLDEIQHAHARAKRELLTEVEQRTGRRLDPTTMTIGFARRATPYKRADLLFSDLDRLRRIAQWSGPLQLVYSGKSHPRDGGGKDVIRRVHQAADTLQDAIPVLYLEDYDMRLGRLLTAGVDLWLNTPQKPQEASGTSGMKAALNGVPSLSVLDGWWIEGHVEGVTGWSIGDGWESESDPSREVTSLYDKLEYLILPTFYGRPDQFARIMRSAIALNGSFFSAQRMLVQYMQDAYRTAE